MFPAYASLDAVRRSAECLEDHDLRTAANNLLQASGYAALGHLRCDVNEAVVVVRGVVPSFYLKQMAQTVIRQLGGVRSVTNLVEVRVTEVVKVG